MITLQLNDTFLEEKFKIDFHHNTQRFIHTIKESLETKERTERNLLKAYSRGELSSGQVAEILNVTKYDVLELLEKYDIPYIEVDEEYLQEEIEAANRLLKAMS